MVICVFAGVFALALNSTLIGCDPLLVESDPVHVIVFCAEFSVKSGDETKVKWDGTGIVTVTELAADAVKFRTKPFTLNVCPAGTADLSLLTASASVGKAPICSVAVMVAVVPSARVPVAMKVTGLVLASFRKAVGNVPLQPPPLFVSRLNVGEAVLKLPGAGETVTLVKFPVTATSAKTFGPGAAI